MRSWADNLTFDVELFANTSASPVGLLSGLETLPWLHAAGFLHEATHLWCFTRTATKTIAWAQASYLSNVIHWFFASFGRRDPVSDTECGEIAARIVELEFITNLRRLLTPLYEGLALYAELDAGWSSPKIRHRSNGLVVSSTCQRRDSPFWAETGIATASIFWLLSALR